MIRTIPMHKIIGMSLGFAIVLLAAPFAFAEHYTFPSTNEENKENDWAHVNVVDVDEDEITLEFVNPRSFNSCFEYRTDGDEEQATDDENFNDNAHDLYPYICLNDESEEMTFEADEYVEIRSVFGAESDERFDWTRFDLEEDEDHDDKWEWKHDWKKDGWKGGWKHHNPDWRHEWREDGFKNFGQFMKFMHNGKDSR